jgi:hypothetical protein
LRKISHSKNFRRATHPQNQIEEQARPEGILRPKIGNRQASVARNVQQDSAKEKNGNIQKIKANSEENI